MNHTEYICPYHPHLSTHDSVSFVTVLARQEMGRYLFSKSTITNSPMLKNLVEPRPAPTYTNVHVNAYALHEKIKN